MPRARLSLVSWKRGAQFRLAALIVALVFHVSGAVRASENSASPARLPLAIENVAVVDVEHGSIVSPRTVLVEAGRIAAIGEPGAVALPESAVRIDGRDQFLIPGLVDMHVHLFNNASHRAPNDWALPLFVAHGVTAVREMAAQPADLAVIARWRAESARGTLIAPRVVAAGVVVRANAPAEIRREVREAHAAGADFIKIFSEASPAKWRAALDEAKAKGLTLCGHIPAAVGLLTAATGGQRSNEHLMQVYEACSTREKELIAARPSANGAEAAKIRDSQERTVLETFDRPLAAQVATALAASDQVQVPTLVLSHFEARGARASFREDSRWSSLRLDEQARWARILDDNPSDQGDLAERRREVSREIVGILHRAGVRLLAGTDTPMPLVYPGSSLHTELELLVEAGLSPAAALRTATLAPAAFLGQSENTGSIAVGQRADLVLLGGNPLLEIKNTQQITAVVLEGRLLRRAELDALQRGAVGQ